MEVSLEKIKANPFRNLKLFPLDQAKIDKLKSSINRTEFWDNVVARAKGEYFELAYGHHRIEAVKQVKGKKAVVDLIIRDLDDPMMLKVMGADNDTIYGVTPNFILETVQAAKSMISKQKSTGTGPRGKGSWLQNRIAKLLDWRVERVKTALAELGMIERKELAPDAIKQLGNMKRAKAFHQEVDRAKKQGRPISLTRQVKLAKDIAETSGTSAEKSVKDILFNDVHPVTYPEPPKDFKAYISETAKVWEKAIRRLDVIEKYKRDLNSPIYRLTWETVQLVETVRSAVEKGNNFLTRQPAPKEKQFQEDSNKEIQFHSRLRLDATKIKSPRRVTKPNRGLKEIKHEAKS